MAKNDVIKPGHFKLAGKSRPSQNEDVNTLGKERFAEEKAAERAAVGKPAPAAQARKKSRLKGAK
jgi:hypothetical protein